MPPSRRSRSYNDADTPIAEFTSGQLVIGICVALFVALTCFLLGVLLGKRDPSLQAHTGAATETVESAREGAQKSPRPGVLDAQAPETPLDPYTTPAERNGPRVTNVAPLGGNESAPPGPTRIRRVSESPEATPEERPVNLTTPEDEDNEEAGTSAPERTQTAAAEPPPPREDDSSSSGPVRLQGSEPPVEVGRPTTESPQTAQQDQPTPTVPAPQPTLPQAREAEQPPAASAAASATGRGSWGIQVASFLGSDRANRAEEARQRVEQETSMRAGVFPSPDGSIHRVLIIGFADKPSATAATQTLRQRNGYSDAFVKELPR